MGNRKFNIRKSIQVMPGSDFSSYKQSFNLILSKAWASASNFCLDDTAYADSKQALSFFQREFNSVVVNAHKLFGFHHKKQGLTLHLTNVFKATHATFLSRRCLREDMASFHVIKPGPFSVPYMGTIKMTEGSFAQLQTILTQFENTAAQEGWSSSRPVILYTITARPFSGGFAPCLIHNKDSVKSLGLEYLVCVFLNTELGNETKLSNIIQTFNSLMQENGFLNLALQPVYSLGSFYSDYPHLEISVEPSFFGASIDPGVHTLEELCMHLLLIADLASVNCSSLKLPLLCLSSSYADLYNNKNNINDDNNE